jgi:hypothetical protein
MVPFLKASGYNTKKDVVFLPISGLMGKNESLIEAALVRLVDPLTRFFFFFREIT